ncbi:hypothetical protein Q6332_29450, partial [Klebsiella pneumoniae]|uniref:hypothetical protein n=1 Tax=Klebsiella pneumoniae TaxID=573 RepID=UPI00272FE638
TRTTGTHAMAANAQVSFCLMFMISPAGIYSFGKEGNGSGGVACVVIEGVWPMRTLGISTDGSRTLGQ